MTVQLHNQKLCYHGYLKLHSAFALKGNVNAIFSFICDNIDSLLVKLIWVDVVLDNNNKSKNHCQAQKCGDQMSRCSLRRHGGRSRLSSCAYCQIHGDAVRSVTLVCYTAAVVAFTHNYSLSFHRRCIAGKLSHFVAHELHRIEKHC